MLDVARRTYLDTIEKIYEHVQEYNETLRIPVRLAYTDLKGYHLTIPFNVENAPSILIKRVVKKKGTTRPLSRSSFWLTILFTVVQCTTKELSSLNDRLQESMVAVYKLSNGVVQDLLKKLRPYASELYSMVECIGLLDMLLSFTNMIALSPVEKPCKPSQCHFLQNLSALCIDTRPVIFERGNLVIKQGRHPLVERSIRERDYVANDLYFDSMSTFHVISGPNCAGKSTYMKSVAIITILAHMGCYVPAVAAFIPLRDRICTRFGTSDDMEENASTFKVEMTETAFILEKATTASLVLIDELGRGTASDEGCALAWSISETLIAKSIYTCFATHFRQLNELASVYINCKCYHLAASFSETNIRYFHTLNDGNCPEFPKYGIQAAKMCGLPQDIIRDAEEIYDRLQSKQQSIRTSIPDSVPRVDSKLLHQLLALIHAGLDKKGTSS
uniref:DNA mismatch repair protein mutS putative n=1 Tax=Albugo laibachii Nc14 TaxID=890382 RepID=F0W3M0_9STRA|nr:DNA mismatch repair protein mutS putative [Albugo laibachii Nc14]CCA16273.1 DNA mismatch repair protein mutS putative [Albugo laibachii Nc14]|eukprot:CCA16273.1 DNA mismatch repair protein mutS putative [Albugo laibachii Nc14]